MSRRRPKLTGKHAAPPAAGSAAPALQRYPAVDMVRGGAIVLMVFYHFCFDLNVLGVTHLRFNDAPWWLTARAVIVGLFLGVAGVSLYLATRRGIRWKPFVRRLSLLVLCAALVSAASYVSFPESYIFFGVLHFIAVASVLGLLFVHLKWANLALGVALLALGAWAQHPVFDSPALQWVGMMTHKPHTEDYVPLVPWFGVVLIGLFLGRSFFGGDAPARPSPARTGWARGLALAGRHSLLIYMVHQPVLLGLLYVALH